jgi:uncharacterized protein
MIRLAALLCGALFGLGLVVSDMANPARVLAFLDITGNWDASLAFVMVGALVPSTLAYLWVRRRGAPVLDTELHIPPRGRIDRRLVIGAALFGVGWGLVGICPGPAIALITTAEPTILLFIAAMLGGMALHRMVHARR